MEQKLKAVFRSGAFFPREQFVAPDGAEFELIVSAPIIVAPRVTDSQERQRILRRVTKRMKENPLPLGAKRFTREELHERR